MGKKYFLKKNSELISILPDCIVNLFLPPNIRPGTYRHLHTHWSWKTLINLIDETLNLSKVLILSLKNDCLKLILCFLCPFSLLTQIGF